MSERIHLLTDWVTIARSGVTADNRRIESDWLTDMAAAYDPDEYTAVVNNDHFYGNLGTVRELRTVKAPDGRIDLQARIEVNKYYLARNAESSGLFFSIEITHDFAGTGKPYLTGLASTDNPASLGTTELHFSKASTPEHFLSVPIAAELSFPGGDDHNRNGAAASFAAEVAAAIKSVFTTTNNKKGKDEMEEKDLTAAVKAAVKEELAEFAKTHTSGTEARSGEEFAKFKSDFEAFKSDFEAFKSEFEALRSELEAYKGKLDKALAEGRHESPPPDTGDAGNNHDELI